MDLFKLTRPSSKKVPILISAPHSGVDFPDEVKDKFQDKFTKHPEDTDWYIHQLYDFAAELGITLIKANYSRYVIDLNRQVDSSSLYSDGRKETTLLPAVTFAGEAISKNEKPDQSEVKRRLEKYYHPYYQKIETELASLVDEFGSALFFDAHSIKRMVKSIQDKPFPDLILGNLDGVTANPNLISTALEALKNSEYEVSHNHPFKGGMLTRYFGNPQNGVHALQLEMVQEIYMDEDSCEYSLEKASCVRKTLRAMFKKLILELEK